MGKAVAKATKKRLTPEERQAKHAFEVESKIKKGCSSIRAVWVALAAYFYEFHEEKMWEQLGHDTFNEWLGTPEIGLGRSQVYALIDVYGELVVKRGLKQDALADLEASKVAVVLPALRRGDVELDDALADCETLSRSALREKYGKKVSAERVPLIECEECGCMKRPKSAEEEAEPIRSAGWPPSTLSNGPAKGDGRLFTSLASRK